MRVGRGLQLDYWEVSYWRKIWWEARCGFMALITIVAVYFATESHRDDIEATHAAEQRLIGAPAAPPRSRGPGSSRRCRGPLSGPPPATLTLYEI